MQVNYTTSSVPQVNALQQLYISKLPNFMYCTNEFSYGVKIKPKPLALSKNYIQINHINSVATIAVDLDYETYPEDLKPIPNLIVYNKDNCRSHALYILETAVHLNQNSSTKAQKYLTDVLNALTAHLGGDPNYAHFMSKNPLSANWRVYMLRTQQYCLDELAEYFPLKPKKQIIPTGFGRNCQIFDTTRHWAYIAIRDFKATNVEVFYRAVLNHCLGQNNAFTTPLHIAEIKHTAKSIALWVWDERYNLTTFTKQQARHKKSLAVRQKKAQLRKQQALELLHQGKTFQQIANALDLATITVYKMMQGN